MSQVKLIYRISDLTGNEEDQGEYAYETDIYSAAYDFFSHTGYVDKARFRLLDNVKKDAFDEGFDCAVEEMLEYSTDKLMEDEIFVDFAKKHYLDDARYAYGFVASKPSPKRKRRAWLTNRQEYLIFSLVMPASLLLIVLSIILWCLAGNNVWQWHTSVFLFILGATTLTYLFGMLQGLKR